MWLPFFGTVPSSVSDLYHLIQIATPCHLSLQRIFLRWLQMFAFLLFFNYLKFIILISMNQLIFSCVILKVIS